MIKIKHLAIIGSTGATGKELVQLAMQSNYKVTVIERSPDFKRERPNLKIIKGDVTDLGSMLTALENIDFVISCFGPSNHRQVGNSMSLGATNIVKACEKNNIKRLVFMSGFVQSEANDFFYPAFSFFTSLMIKLMRSYYKDSYKDKIIAEAAIQNSKVDWVIVRASGLNHNAATGEYTAGIKAKVSPFRFLPFADCAQCLLDAVENNGWTKEIINVGKV